MKIKALFFATFFLLGVISSYGNNPLFSDSIQKGRVVLVSSSLALAVGGSYYYVQNAWWNEKQIPFHFDDGSDKVYALNVDKAGHFLGGLQAADLFASAMLWAGMNEKKALDPYSANCVLLGMKNKGNMKDSTFKHFNPMALREKYSIGSKTNTSNSSLIERNLGKPSKCEIGKIWELFPI